jgi:phosphate/sulfate permease
VTPDPILTPPGSGVTFGAVAPSPLASEVAAAVAAQIGKRRPPRVAVALFGGIGAVLGIAFLGWRWIRKGSRRP